MKNNKILLGKRKKSRTHGNNVFFIRGERFRMPEPVIIKNAKPYFRPNERY
jgi:hypothetical protein